MAQGKQAKILTVKQEAFILHHLTTTRYPLRDRTMFLLSMKAGPRAKEMAALTWAMVTEADGQVGEALHLVNTASKGDTGGRTIPLHRELHAALVALAQQAQTQGERLALERPVLRSERGGGLSAATVQGWFQRLYDTLELAGCSSHSGRRTFITRAARKVSEVGGSLRDVQQLAGHSYDGDWVYWSRRRGHDPTVQTRVATLLKRQSGRCTSCGQYFHHDDQLEVDHINGDRRDSRYSNLQALHGYCHDAKTREHREYLPVGMRDKHRHTEERRDRKRSCAVLEQR